MSWPWCLRLSLLAALLAGCPDEDASEAVDAGPVDSGSVDAETSDADGRRDVDAAPDAGADDAGAGDAGPPAELVWTPCGGRAECGTLVVPVDHAQPDGPTMSLALIRWPALDPDDRIGVLVYGPGGPGGSGVDAVRQLPRRAVPGMGEVVRRFDLVGIDVRGTGASVPRIECGEQGAALALAQRYREAADDEAAGAIVDEAIGLCEAALDAEVLPYFDTLSTARDVEALRVALGEEQLSFLGESYGTWFTTVYAVTHPERVRAAVLVSALQVSPAVFARNENRIRGTERAIGAFLDWCDATETCPLRQGDESAREAFEAVVARVLEGPIDVPGARPFTAADLGDLLWFAFYGSPYAEVADAMAALREGDALPAFTGLLAVDQIARSDADALGVIRALDDAVPPDATLDDWRAHLDALRPEVPLYGPLLPDRDFLTHFTLAWPHRRGEPFAVRPIPETPPFLFIAGRFDAATPVEGAETLRAAFENGSVMLQTQNIGHVALAGPCAFERAEAYLLDPAGLAGEPARIECPVKAADESVVGQLTEALPWVRGAANVGETALGDLVTDAILATSGADVAVINGGGIRTGLPAASVLPADTTLRRDAPGYAEGPPFDVVVDDVRAMLPFGNRIAIVELSGAELWAFLEWSLETYAGPGMPSPNFVQVAGARIVAEASAPPGERLVSVSRADGTPIEPDATPLRLALSDFVVYGGTGYFELLTGGEPEIGALLDDAVIELFRAADGPVEPGVDGRIEIRP